MKKNEVPQDKSNLESANFKELYYAIDENGEYTTELSTGWDPKTIALNNAIEAINERISDSKQRVKDHKVSPLEYYMELHKMDLPILASYAGIWKLRVKRHFRPAIFKNLNNKTLQKYADVFDITIEELQRTDL